MTSKLQKHIATTQTQLQSFDFTSENAGRLALAVAQNDIAEIQLQLKLGRNDLRGDEQRVWYEKTHKALTHRMNEARLIKAWIRDNLGKVDQANLDDSVIALLKLYRILQAHVRFQEMDEDEQEEFKCAQDLLYRALGTTNIAQVQI